MAPPQAQHAGAHAHAGAARAAGVPALAAPPPLSRAGRRASRCAIAVVVPAVPARQRRAQDDRRPRPRPGGPRPRAVDLGRGRGGPPPRRGRRRRCGTASSAASPSRCSARASTTGTAPTSWWRPAGRPSTASLLLAGRGGARLPRAGPRARVLRHERRSASGPSRPTAWACIRSRVAVAGRAAARALRRRGVVVRPRRRPRRPTSRCRRHRRDDLVLFYARAVTAAPRRAARPARARGAQAPPARGRDRAVRRGAQDPHAVQAPRARRHGARQARRTPTRARPVGLVPLDDEPVAGPDRDDGLRAAGGGPRRAVDARRRSAPTGRSSSRAFDPLALCDAIERLLDDLELRAERSRAGAELAAGRTWARAAEQVEAGLRAALT